MISIYDVIAQVRSAEQGHLQTVKSMSVGHGQAAFVEAAAQAQSLLTKLETIVEHGYDFIGGVGERELPTSDK
jgi:hypothetical protein